MIPILLISNKPFTGRNLLALGLALNLKEKGYKVSYMKLLGKVPYKKGEKIIDEEAYFIREMLELSEPVEYASPFVYTYQAQYQFFEGVDLKIDKKVAKIIKKQQEKDIIFLIGGDSFFEGFTLKIDPLSLTKKLSAKVLIVETWDEETSIDDILGMKKLVKDKFLGVVLNKVPEEQFLYVKDTVVPYLKNKEVEVFGIFKRDKFLESITIKKLLEVVNGRIMCREDKINEFVENLLVGAMDPEQAFSYFIKVPNKAVITGVQRTDIQILAMETSTKCLILTGGGTYVDETVLHTAKDKGIPIIISPYDTFTTVDKIRDIMGRAILKEREKALKFKEIVAKEFAWDKFFEKLGLSK